MAVKNNSDYCKTFQERLGIHVYLSMYGTMQLPAWRSLRISFRGISLLRRKIPRQYWLESYMTFTAKALERGAHIHLPEDGLPRPSQ